jgi:hypothetical protein
MSKKKPFDSLDAITRLMDSMADAIDNMIEEVRKPVDSEVTGSARKAELQSVKQTALDCQEMIKRYQELAEMKRELSSSHGILSEQKEYQPGFAERFSK